MPKTITGGGKPMKRRNKVNKTMSAKRDLTGVNTPLEIKETEESTLIVATLGEISPGTQRSADFFNEKLPEGHPARVTRASVWNWANGVYRVDEKRLNVWKIIHSPGDTRYDLALTIMALRQRDAENLAAHWVGEKPFPRANEEEIAKEDGKKLLEQVKVKKAVKA